MQTTPLADRLVFTCVNAWLHLTRFPLVLRFRRHVGRWPDIATPRSTSDMVIWRKLFDHNPLFVTLTDKAAAKAWIAERAPGLPIPETLLVADRPEAIPDALLTPGYVIKATNASGQNYLPHRGELPRAEVNRMIRGWFRRSALKRWLGWLDNSQEWANRQLPPRLIVERQVLAGATLVDVSIRAINGRATYVSCALDNKSADKTLGYFTTAGQPLAGEENTLPPDFRLPESFAAAIAFAEQLSRGIDYVRVDFLCAGTELHAGEITPYPAGGFGTDSWWSNLMQREWLDNIELSWALSTPQPWPRRVYLQAFRRWAKSRGKA